MRPTSGLISRWATFGYDRDAWQASLLDIIGFVSDPDDPATPLPEPGMACIVGLNAVGQLSEYSYGDILVHGKDPDSLFVRKPEEVRVVIQRPTGELWMWNFTQERWVSVGKIDNVEGITTSIPLSGHIISTKKIELSKPVLNPPPMVFLVGCGPLYQDINFWMPDNKTITFDKSAGPDSLGNFPIQPDVDILRLRYMTPGLPRIGG